MNFLDIFDIFSSLLMIEGKKPKPKKSKVFILFKILTVLGILWLVLELNSIFDLISPVVFLLVFIIAGLILTFGIIVLINKLNIVEEFRKREFFLVLVPVTLLTISLASFLNRTQEINKYETVVSIRDPLQGSSITKVFVKLDDVQIRIRVPKSIGSALKNGDSIILEKTKGIIGFEIISDVKKFH